MDLSKQGILLVLSGPSGAGKGTVVNNILARQDDYVLSVSDTTRAPRPGEIDGVHYNFITNEEFAAKIEADGYLEYNCYGGNYYGTPKTAVENKLEEGLNVILEIDVNGGTQIRSKVSDCVRIMILPPDPESLEARLRGRNTSTEEDLKYRLERAKEEISYFESYDYAVINEDGRSDDAALEVITIIDAEKHKTSRNLQIPDSFQNDH